jgi:hypothetical protein
MPAALLDRLNRAFGARVSFYEASAAVVRGAELTEAGAVGGSVAISRAAPFTPPASELAIGRELAAGDREPFDACELRCFAKAGQLAVAVFDGDQRVISRVLHARGVSPTDEGLFTWFGPVEYVHTPWSDNDPPQCQVVTVETLRRFARTWAFTLQCAHAKASLAQAVVAALPESIVRNALVARHAEALAPEDREVFRACAELGRAQPCGLVKRLEDGFDREADWQHMLARLPVDATEAAIRDAAATATRSSVHAEHLTTLYRFIRRQPRRGTPVDWRPTSSRPSPAVRGLGVSIADRTSRKRGR